MDVQVFLTNMKDDFKIYNKIYAEYFKDNQPCRTTIEIKKLAYTNSDRIKNNSNNIKLKLWIYKKTV